MNAEQELKELEDKWYEFHLSILYIPEGEIARVKGPWTEDEPAVEMIAALKKEYPENCKMFVVSSRCGGIHAEDADEWLERREIMREAYEAECAYIKAGICSGCGARNAKEAETMCKPSPLADTGDYTCAGEMLWEEEENV